MNMFCLKILLLSATCFASYTAQCLERSTPLYRKVKLSNGMNSSQVLPKVPINGFVADNDGILRLQFDVSVSESGHVTSIKSNAIEENKAYAEKIMDIIRQKIYVPEIRNYQVVSSVAHEYSWLSLTYPSKAPPSAGCREDARPFVLKQKAVVYPVSLIVSGVKGATKLEFSVSEEGKAVDIEAIEYDHELFARHAKISLASWKFKPAKHQGQYVSCRVVIDFDYKY